MTLYALGAFSPEFPESGNWWSAPDAQIIGKVIFKENASVWFGVVIRGDNEAITIGENSNVQDKCVLHTDMGYPLTIGSHSVIGHQVVLHGCEIGDNTLIGMGATVMNGAKIGNNCLIGSHALITENVEVPDNSMVLGAPGKVVKTLNDDAVNFIRLSALSYVDNWKRFKSDLRELDT